MEPSAISDEEKITVVASFSAVSLTISTFGVVDPRVFQIAGAVAVAAAFGDSSRSHREYVRAATERAEQTREAEAHMRVVEERLRIAQDLHDTVAHQISVISLNAGVATSNLEKDPDRASTALGAIRTSARGALREIGDLLHYLRAGDQSAVATPPQPGLDDIETLIDRVRGAGLEVTLERNGDLSNVHGTPAQVAYRIIQEGLTNAHKHGSGNSCSVVVSASEDALSVAISNPVSDQDRNNPQPPQSGLGLVGIRERVASIRGTVNATSENGLFTLTARLPLRGKESR